MRILAKSALPLAPFAYAAFVIYVAGCAGATDKFMYGKSLPKANEKAFHQGREVPTFDAPATATAGKNWLTGKVIKHGIAPPQNGGAEVVYEFCSKLIPFKTETRERARKNGLNT